MLIPAYRMRGHLHANLDPLGSRAAQGPRGTRSPPLYGFADTDLDRPIFLDHVTELNSGPCGKSWRSSSAPTARRWKSSS